MNRHIAIYGLYCLGVVVLAMFAVRDGYSPFATGGARAPLLLGGYGGGYGPNHK